MAASSSSASTGLSIRLISPLVSRSTIHSRRSRQVTGRAALEPTVTPARSIACSSMLEHALFELIGSQPVRPRGSGDSDLETFEYLAPGSPLPRGRTAHAVDQKSGLFARGIGNKPWLKWSSLFSAQTVSTSGLGTLRQRWIR